MKKNFSLIILLLSFWSVDCYASFWDTLGSAISTCVNNVCNCGGGDVTEHWNDVTMRTVPTDQNCPPYNRSRPDNTCLVQASYNYPASVGTSNYNPSYLNYCAEDTPENLFTGPKIRLRSQACNSFACWTLVQSLSWDGECLEWPTPWGLPLLRICARVANPADTTIGASADPGYTEGTHLDSQGQVVADPVIIGSDGLQVTLTPPKLCAYRDPSLFDFDGSGDVFDYNPVKQPFHNTGGINPIAQILIFLLQNSQSGTLSDNWSSAVSNSNNKLAGFVEFIGDVMKYIGNSFASLLQQYGQFNRVVSENLGCVQIPLGPYPPPYCPTLSAFIPTPITQNICLQNRGGTISSSTSTNLCVVSKLTNNFIRNAIRISYDNLVPLCSNGENPQLTDKCVTLSNASAASVFHASSARRDAIKLCSAVSGSTPCVNTKIPFSCSVSQNGCEDGFRVVYSVQAGSTYTLSSYFNDDLLDCNGTTNLNCQQIWGINTGEYIDVPLVFPSQENPANASTALVSSASIKDTTGQTKSFSAKIVRQLTQVSGNLSQDPSQICVFNSSGNVIGCQKRGAYTLPIIYDCSTNYNGLSCTNTYFQPAFIAAMTVGSDVTAGAFVPLSVQNTSNTNYSMSLAGYNFSSFVTDNTYIQKPFSGTNSLNSSSIYGTYKNNVAPYDSSGNPTNATYLSGLEYFNDKYIDGGVYACLQQQDLVHCPSNVQNCVLTKLLNGSTVSRNLTDRQYPLPACGILLNGTGLCSGDTYDYYMASSCSSGLCKVDTTLAANKYNYYYNINGTYGGTAGNAYNNTLYVLRDKTSAEFGLCTSIPQPVCAAVTSPGTNDGNATWPQGQIGQQVSGTCPSGWVLANASKPLLRYCLASAQTQTVAFEPVQSGGGCVQGIVLTSQSDTYPVSYPRTITTNTNSSGSILLGSASTKSTNIMFPSGGGGIYTSTLTFYISATVSSITNFQITEIDQDDFVLIKVNNQKVYSSPNSFSSLSYNSATVRAIVDGAYQGETGRWWYSSGAINLKPYLVQGTNTISLTHVVIGGGGLYYKVDYKL